MKIMKPHLLAAGIVAVGFTLTVRADDNMSATTTNNDNSDSGTASYASYRAHEISIDLFGSGSVGEQTIDHLSGSRVEHDGRLGAGGGINYFFTRYIGIGGDAYTENTANNFIDSSSGNLIGRLPIGNTGLAPYIFGGGGYDFDEVSQGFGQVGGGLEFRFMRHAGLFVDARYVIADRTDNYGVGRAGLRINF